MTIDSEAVKASEARITDRIDTLSGELIELSLDIHSHPELNYQEHHAAKVLADALQKHGFAVERGVGGVETAFRAEARGAGGGPTVAILAEYDALPGIGHGCGHNLIALSTVGAGLGVKAALDSTPGNLLVIGTPAEEGGGGKIRLLDAGVFQGVDVALSSHPSSNRTAIPTDIPFGEVIGLTMIGFRYEFFGKAAHAAVAPHLGINALNAVVHLFTGIDALRQHLRDDVRIHGIITDGGVAANVVPDFAAADFMLRSRSPEYLRDVVVGQVQNVAEGAALLTGARLEVKPAHPTYEGVLPNSTLAKLAKAHAASLGMRLDEPRPEEARGAASTDFGNVSQVMPAFAMRFAAGTEPIPGHSIQMCEAAKSDFAQERALEVAKAIALTARDLLTTPEIVTRARTEFEERRIAHAKQA